MPESSDKPSTQSSSNQFHAAELDRAIDCLLLAEKSHRYGEPEVNHSSHFESGANFPELAKNLIQEHMEQLSVSQTSYCSSSRMCTSDIDRENRVSQVKMIKLKIEVQFVNVYFDTGNLSAVSGKSIDALKTMLVDCCHQYRRIGKQQRNLLNWKYWNALNNKDIIIAYVKVRPFLLDRSMSVQITLAILKPDVQRVAAYRRVCGLMSL
ncbi:unnamed protein product [Echinostoma caproni]|uniref:FERM domain-containing protein n=1 Tax=Echinostoma caproni TaxID=27848 RepID=A0A183APX0_9TREM|nr:unnamed protein product [Echinostoma caproni]